MQAGPSQPGYLRSRIGRGQLSPNRQSAAERSRPLSPLPLSCALCVRDGWGSQHREHCSRNQHGPTRRANCTSKSERIFRERNGAGSEQDERPVCEWKHQFAKTPPPPSHYHITISPYETQQSPTFFAAGDFPEKIATHRLHTFLFEKLETRGFALFKLWREVIRALHPPGVRLHIALCGFGIVKKNGEQWGELG